MTLSILLGSIELGLIFAILSLGLFIAFRILHTKLKIHAILAGILTMTGLYSKIFL